MIHAINKHGREAYFTERVWDMMPKDKNGWVEFSAQGEVLVPQQVVEFQQLKKKAVAVVDENTETQIAPEPIKVEKQPEPKPKITKARTKPVKTSKK